MSGSVWVRRPGSALMQPAELPRLTPQAAIDRSWQVPAGRVLLEPRRPEYLTTDPIWPWAGAFLLGSIVADIAARESSWSTWPARY